MLSQTAEHALRALLYLAQHSASGPVATEVVADAIGAPRNYLAKTLGVLARQGIVSSLRGPHGGFRLEVPAAELPVVRVLEAFDEAATGRGVCLLGGRACDDRRPCAAHARWKTVCQASLAPLRSTTLADLLGRAPAEAREDEVTTQLLLSRTP